MDCDSYIGAPVFAYPLGFLYIISYDDIIVFVNET